MSLPDACPPSRDLEVSRQGLRRELAAFYRRGPESLTRALLGCSPTNGGSNGSSDKSKSISRSRRSFGYSPRSRRLGQTAPPPALRLEWPLGEPPSCVLLFCAAWHKKPGSASGPRFDGRAFETHWATFSLDRAAAAVYAAWNALAHL